MRGAVLGAIAGAALATLPGGAGIGFAVGGATAGALIGWRFARGRAGFSPWSLAMLLFLVPAFVMPVAPGADMAMHVALARGLLDGVLSPAWPGVVVGAYPRGFSSVVALLSPAGLARAGLLAAGIACLVFWAGLSAMLESLRTPAARTIAAVAVLLSRTPQIFFDWGGNPTAMALGLALFGAAQEGPVAAFFFAGASAIHPMGALAGALAFCTKREFSTRRAWVPLIAGVAGIGIVFGVLALFGPRLSAGEARWLRDYAVRQESAGFGVLGDPANVATALAAAWLLYKRDWRPVARTAAGVVAMIAVFLIVPYAGLYPARFAPMLLLVVVPLWARAAMARFQLIAPAAVVLALPFHFRWFHAAVPMATWSDLKAIRCAAEATPKHAVIDGAYGDATQWIPALAGRAVTRPHLHVSLFDEMPPPPAEPSFRFAGDRLRYPPAIEPPPATTPLCDGKLYPLR